MSSFHISLLFYIELLGVAALYRGLAPRLSPANRALLLVGASLLFLAQLNAHSTFIIATLAYAGVVAAAVSAIGRIPRLKQTVAATAAVIVTALAALLIFKYRYYTSLLLGGLTLPSLSGFEWLGLSYMTFRAIDMVVQVRRARGEPPAPATAVAFLLFFPAYLAGPVNRFQEFVRDLAGAPAPLAGDDLRATLLRMAIGVIKVLAIAELFRANSLMGVNSTEGMSAGAILLALYCQFAFIYFDFSGYSDVAIATARLFGIRLPENFNFPFLARNLQEFWNRWHISFAHWCRDYIYFVLLRALRMRARFISDVSANVAAIFATFFFMGAWHGDGLNWILYGVYHGAGMSALVVGRRLLASVAPGAPERLAQSRAFAALSIFTTITFVSVGLLLTQRTQFAWETAGRLLGG